MRLNTRAFAIAGGAVASGATFVVTLLWLIRPGALETPSFLGALLFGYSVSVAGAFIGAMWSYMYGFLLAAAFAFAYNMAAAPRPVE
ncbi:MAG: hypothetical protein ACE5HP_08740 [Gemmatimonadota bacterium]